MLLDSSGGMLKELDARRQDLGYLGTLGIAARYSGTEADAVDAEDALKIAEEMRDVIRGKLGIS